jgi:hypothetical protein
MNVLKISTLAAVVLLLLSCGKNPATEPNYDHTMPGKWVSDDEPKDFVWKKYYLTFRCDSFYLHFIHFSDAVYLDDHPKYCDRKFNQNYKEYAKGTFTSTKDLLSLKGLYTTENYEPAVEGCETGEFLIEYNYTFEKGELVLKNDSRRENFRLEKIEKYGCEMSK